MPLNLTLQQLAAASDLDLPDPAPIRVGPDQLRHFMALVGAGAAVTARPAEEIDPLVSLALLPSMLADMLVITDASAHRITGLNNCVFIRSVPPDAEISVSARLIEAKVNGDGHVVYRLGFAWRIKDELQPTITGELIGIAGNPRKG